MRLRQLCLLLTLALPLTAQNKPFSQPIQWGTTSPWQPKDSIVAGAVVAPLVALYCYRSGNFENPALMTVLFVAALEALYEVMRAAEGKAPLPMNAAMAGLGAAGVSLSIHFTWGRHHRGSWKVGR